MTVFEPNPAFEAELLRSIEVAEMLDDVVEEAAARAVELAPDDPTTNDRDLHRSIFGDVAMTAHGYRGRVGATNFKAPWFEEGAVNVDQRPFLRPAVEQVVGPIEADTGEDD